MIEKIKRRNTREKIKKHDESAWKVEGTGLPNSGSELWIIPFHATPAELDEGISPGDRTLH